MTGAEKLPAAEHPVAEKGLSVFVSPAALSFYALRLYETWHLTSAPSPSPLNWVPVDEEFEHLIR